MSNKNKYPSSESIDEERKKEGLSWPQKVMIGGAVTSALVNISYFGPGVLKDYREGRAVEREAGEAANPDRYSDGLFALEEDSQDIDYYLEGVGTIHPGYVLEQEDGSRFVFTPGQGDDGGDWLRVDDASAPED